MDIQAARKVAARDAAARALNLAAMRGTEAMDAYGAWLLAGFTAAFVFMLGNMDVVGQFVKPGAVKLFGAFLVPALGLTIVSRFVSFWIVGVAKASAESRDIVRTAENIDLDEFVKEMRRALVWPGTVFSDFAFKKLREGDLAFVSRTVTRVAHVHSLCIALQAAILFGAFVVLVAGLKY